MASGEFVPMVSLDHPEQNLHREFQMQDHIVEAFTYNGHLSLVKRNF